MTKHVTEKVIQWYHRPTKLIIIFSFEPKLTSTFDVMVDKNLTRRRTKMKILINRIIGSLTKNCRHFKM